MDALGWLIAYVVGFGLLQLLLYRYFQREDPSPDATPRMDRSRAAAVEGGEEPATDGVYCDNCGAHNEAAATYSYCRECVSLL